MSACYVFSFGEKVSDFRIEKLKKLIPRCAGLNTDTCFQTTNNE